MLQVLLWLGVYIKFVHKNSSVKKGAQSRSPSQKVLLQMRCVLSTKNNAPNMFYIDDVKVVLRAVLCVWKENHRKGHSVIDFIWDFPKQRCTLSCWCEERFTGVLWSAMMNWTRILKRPLRTFRKARARKLVEERGRRGRESDGKNSRVSEMKVRRHCRRKLKLLWEAHMNTTEC